MENRPSVNNLLRYVLLGMMFTVCYAASPTPFDASKVDWSKVPNADAQVDKMITHRNALSQRVINEVLPEASDDVKSSLDKAQNLQKDIDDMARRGAHCDYELAKAHKACWRNLLIGGIIGAILGLFGPKLLGLASMVGV